jgi:hypothetical protein
MKKKDFLEIMSCAVDLLTEGNFNGCCNCLYSAQAKVTGRATFEGLWDGFNNVFNVNGRTRKKWGSFYFGSGPWRWTREEALEMRMTALAFFEYIYIDEKIYKEL